MMFAVFYISNWHVLVCDTGHYATKAAKVSFSVLRTWTMSACSVNLHFFLDIIME